MRCWLLYDNVGSKGLPAPTFRELRDAGVAVQGFVTNRQFGRQFQINFRNHRKLVVVDGKVAFFGGLNAGDGNCNFPACSDPGGYTPQLEGPAVMGLKYLF